jgi:hypothetical protein
MKIKYFVLNQQEVWAVGNDRALNYFQIVRTFPLSDYYAARDYANRMNQLTEQAIERLNSIQ